MIDQVPILLTGCPRSGATMVAAVINTCGAFTGKHYKKSMYCNDSIRETIVVPYLDRMGVDTKGQFPLPDTYGLTIPLDWKERIDKILESEGYNGGQWLYKDSRSALIWRVWNRAYPDAKWIIVRRRTADIVQSCMKTAYMSAFKKNKNLEYTNSKDEFAAWVWYANQYERRFVEMMQSGVNCKIMWPERMIDGNYKQIHEVVDWLGLEWTDKALESINTLLWGEPIKERSVS
jgi:hypothetical protein